MKLNHEFMKALKTLQRIFFSIFKLPESMTVFISGILLTTAINIVTGQIKNNGFIWHHKWNITLSTILMFISSACFMILTTYVKPLQEKHKKNHPLSIRLSDKDIWVEDIINQKGVALILSILFVFTYILALVSLVLLFL